MYDAPTTGRPNRCKADTSCGFAAAPADEETKRLSTLEYVSLTISLELLLLPCTSTLKKTITVDAELSWKARN